MKQFSSYVLGTSFALCLMTGFTFGASSSSQGESVMPSFPVVSSSGSTSATPIRVIGEDTSSLWQSTLTDVQQTWMGTTGVKVKEGMTHWVATDKGTLDHIAWWPEASKDFWQYASLAKGVPQGGVYVFDGLNKADNELACFAWAMGQYEFNRYKKPSDPSPYPTLIAPEGTDLNWVKAAAEATALVRDCQE